LFERERGGGRSHTVYKKKGKDTDGIKLVKTLKNARGKEGRSYAAKEGRKGGKTDS